MLKAASLLTLFVRISCQEDPNERKRKPSPMDDFRSFYRSVSQKEVAGLSIVKTGLLESGEPSPYTLVVSNRGTLASTAGGAGGPPPFPLIISVSHGGLLKPDDVPKRQKGVSDMDWNTMQLGLAVLSEVRKLTGRAPGLTALHLNRGWTDANRGTPYNKMDTAYDSPLGKLAYDQFHGELASLVSDFRARGLRPLLIDIHGNSEKDLEGFVEPGFGGKSAAFLPELRETRDDLPEALFKGKGLFRLMEKNGLSIYRGPPIFNGGYIVRHTSSTHGVDSIQLEFAFAYRDPEGTAEATGRKLAKCLVPFMAAFGYLDSATAAAILSADLGDGSSAVSDLERSLIVGPPSPLDAGALSHLRHSGSGGAGGAGGAGPGRDERQSGDGHLDMSQLLGEGPRKKARAALEASGLGSDSAAGADGAETDRTD